MKFVAKIWNFSMVYIMAALMAARIICYPAYMKWSIFTYISLRKTHMGIIEAKAMFQKGAAISAAIK